MIALSTYSGECDGLGYAAEMAGIEVAAYCEADPKRRARLAEKHPGKPIFESDELLTKEALDAHGIRPDIIFGGPPCQPFSCAGAQRGTADPRHRWPQMLRIIQECRPRWVLIENVGGFVRLALDLVWTDLEAEGYQVGAVVLPALAVGAPHRRDRCFVVAHSGSIGLREQGICSQQPRGAEAVGAGENVGDTKRCGLPGNNGRRTGQEFAGRCKGVAYHNGIGRAEGGAEPNGFLRAAHSSRAGSEDDTGWRAAQSRLGGVLDGVSRRLDEQMTRWPAWRGQEQHPWEPPRTVCGMKDRPRRIESLGLAVVLWQVYPIMALIKELDDMEREDDDEQA